MNAPHAVRASAPPTLTRLTPSAAMSWRVRSLAQPISRLRGFGATAATKATIWSSDSNLNAFYLHDAATGVIKERMQLPDDSPVIHCAKLVGDQMYFCDDMGWMCRFKI